MRTVQRRKNVRVPANKAVRFVTRDKGREGVAIDIGVGGVLLETDFNMIKGDVLELFMGGDLGVDEFSVKGMVVSVRRAAKPRYGIQFLDMAPAAMALLGDYLIRLLGPEEK